MTQITIDFSPKGGPKTATGVWVKNAGKETITWPDGNVWTLMPKPSAAVMADDGLADHAGFFKDPNHYQPGSWAGLRAIAEFPPHVLTMVGSDDGTTQNLWSLVGTCSGAEMTEINFDFSPKGGPAKLTGTWSTPTRTITWPDGNVWVKLGAFSTVVAASLGAAAAPAASAFTLTRLVVAGAIAAVAVAAAVGIRRYVKVTAGQPLPL